MAVIHLTVVTPEGLFFREDAVERTAQSNA